MNLIKKLIGSGDKVMRTALPVFVIGLILNIIGPEVFAVGGPAPWLRTLSIIVLIPGVILWLWSVALVLLRVPQGKLITTGPYALMRHPLYTSFGLLVLPWAGFLLNTWLGVPVGLALYLGTRRYAGEEDAALHRQFGAEWEAYNRHVALLWL
jgi:protein-S-isoprenylcysteine O-methyltransferase Ste14